MASLRDLESRLKNLFSQGVSTVSNAVSNPLRTATNVFNFSANPVGNTLNQVARQAIRIPQVQQAKNTVLNTKLLPGQVNTLGQSFNNVMNSPGRGIFSSDLASGRLNTGNNLLDTNIYRPTGHALNALIQSSSAGLIQPPSQKTQTIQDKIGAGIGFGAGMINPISVGSKVLSPIGQAGSRIALRGVESKALPAVIKSGLGALGSEAAQTAALTAGNAALGNQFDPTSALVQGLGLRGVGGASIKVNPVLRNTLKDVSPNAFKIHPDDQALLKDVIGRYQAKQKVLPEDLKDIQTLAEHYLGKKFAMAPTKKIMEAFDYVLAAQNDGVTGKTPTLNYLVGDNVSSEGKVTSKGVKAVNLPTQVESLNRAEVNAGNPDLYLQRKAKLAGNPEPLPWETSKPSTTPDINLPTDGVVVRQAEARTVLNNEGKGGIGGLNSDVKGAFQDWVNSRRASKVEGLIKNKEFSDLNNQGMEGIFTFQGGEKTGRLGDVKKYFDNKYNELTKAGVDLGYKSDYLPQIWANPPEQVEQVLGRSLGTKASFTLESVIKDYKEGISKGLTPKFNNISDLTGWYEQRANKLLADKQFFGFLGKDGFIQPAGKSPKDWVTIDADRFPKYSVKTESGQYGGVFKAPPELAKLINNYLRDPQFEMLDKIANFVSNAKNVTLSFGIPGTAINAHGFNILARHTIFGSGGNPVSRLWTGGRFLLNQKSAEAELNKTLSTAPQAVKSGLTLGTEDHTAFLNEIETSASKLSKTWNNLFEKPLFNKMIPALKLSSYNALVKEGIDPRDAAKIANNVYGGINWEQMGRNRDAQNLLRSLILAPDWAETTLRLGGNLAKSFATRGPVAARYRVMAATMLGTYVSMNIANKLSSGHFMYENDPGHTFEIEAGYTGDGQKRYLRPLGTSADFVRLPFDIIAGLAKGDPTTAFRAVSNRLSIPAGSTMHLLTNTDYKGQPIYGRDKYGNELTALQSAGGVGSEALGFVGFPSFAKNAIDFATGKQGGEQAVTGAFELPTRYSGGAYSTSQKLADSLAKKEGYTGKDLYDLNTNLRGISLSENQKQAVQTGGLSTLNQLVNAKKEQQKVKEQLQSDNGVSKAYADERKTNIYYYLKNGKVESVDLNPPTKGTGIDAFVNSDWKADKVRQIYASGLSTEQKSSAYQQLGFTPIQAEYDYKATRTNDIKSQYVQSRAQQMDHGTLLTELAKGRLPSVSGAIFVSDGVINDLIDAGYLSKAEGKVLKDLDYDKKTGQLKAKAGKKGKKIALAPYKAPQIKPFTLKLSKPTSVKFQAAPTIAVKSTQAPEGGFRVKPIKVSISKKPTLSA